MKQQHLREHRSAIESIFAPKSVALIGATDTPGSIGRALTENLREFKGRVHFINQKKDSVLDVATCATIGQIPEPVDLAVIISAGFKEIDARGRELEKQIADARGAVRIIGPNCVGIMLPHIGLNATFAKPLALPAIRSEAADGTRIKRASRRVRHSGGANGGGHEREGSSGKGGAVRWPGGAESLLPHHHA